MLFPRNVSFRGRRIRGIKVRLAVLSSKINLSYSKEPHELCGLSHLLRR